MLAGGTFAALSVLPKQVFSSVPAAKWLIPLLGNIAAKTYGMNEADLKGKKFNAFRNYVFSQATIMKLYQVYCTGGEEAVAAAVNGIVTSQG